MGTGGGGSLAEPVFLSWGFDGDASWGVEAFAGFFKMSTAVLIVAILCRDAVPVCRALFP